MLAEEAERSRHGGQSAATSSSVPLTVIVPTWHDDTALGELLSDLARPELRPEHVIVVDGAASERTASVCRRWSVSWLPSIPNRGVQLSIGASVAKEALSGNPAGTAAGVLWFLHADCRLHPHSAAAIRAAVAGGAIGGYFRFRFAGAGRVVKTLLECCIALRCRVGMVYGDQGIFVTRGAYDASPGVAPQPLFEEVPLVRYLKRNGRFVALAVPLLVSPRRWERDGYFRRTLKNRLLALGYLLGIPTARLARWYRSAPSQRA